jgi:hypothetical protein
MANLRRGIFQAAKGARKMWIIGLITLVGCGGMDVQDFADAKPEFRIEEFFEGQTRGWGLFEDRFGTMRRSFVVDINGYADGDEFVLEEDFLYDDGEVQRRVWRITPLGDGRYEGTAGDIVGKAQGARAGNALNWTYDMDLKVGDSTWRVAFDDWMFLQPGGVLMNRAYVKRWGFQIGSVTLSFSKPGSQMFDRMGTADPDARADAVSGQQLAAE